MSAAGRDCAGFPRLLNGRTRDGAERAEYAAVAPVGSQDSLAPLAIIEELTGIGRHGLGFLMPALGTGQTGPGLHQRSALSACVLAGYPALVDAAAMADAFVRSGSNVTVAVFD